MKKLLLLSLSLLAFCQFTLMASEDVAVIHLSPSDGDVTTEIRNKLESVTSPNVKIIFEKGSYYLAPDFAFERYCAITNHGNGSKKIAFHFDGLESLAIEGNGAELIFHGQMFPFLFEGCSNVTVSDLVIDWDIPFTHVAEVVAVNEKEGWREVRPLTDGFSWEFKGGEIRYPNVDGFNYKYLGSTLPFDKETKRVVVGAVDTHSNPTKIEKHKDGIFRIYEKARYYPPVGSLLSSKGNREDDRYAPAFDFKECHNVNLNGVTVHHALGMAYLFERTEDITLRDCNVKLREGSPRVISSTADASHFANCRGQILLDGCTLENMLDDGNNVHGP